MLLSIPCLSSQWLDGDEAEDEAVAEEGGEAGEAQGDNEQVACLLPDTSTVCTGFFFSQEETFCEFSCFCSTFVFPYFVH